MVDTCLQNYVSSPPLLRLNIINGPGHSRKIQIKDIFAQNFTNNRLKIEANLKDIPLEISNIDLKDKIPLTEELELCFIPNKFPE
jgi:hypothetical protein